MPLTKKGSKIKAAMEDEYGKRKGERVFYAAASKGALGKVEKAPSARKAMRKTPVPKRKGLR